MLRALDPLTAQVTGFGLWPQAAAIVGPKVLSFLECRGVNPRAVPMPDVSGIVAEPYTAYSSDPTFRALQSAFAQQFGPSFPTFSIEAFLLGDPPGDTSYATRILERIGFCGEEDKAEGRGAALLNLLSYFRARSGGAVLPGGAGSGLFPMVQAGLGGGGVLPLILGGLALFMFSRRRR